MATVRILEEIEAYTALGLRFWDPATDRQIGDGLRVRAWPVQRTQTQVEAQRSSGGIYLFPRLPGLRDLEYGYVSGALQSPPSTRDYGVAVTDLRGRYLPVALTVSLPLPYRGVFLSGGVASPGDAAPQGLHLYSSPGRPLPPAATAIRGELLRVGDREPAAHAVVRVDTEEGQTWYGLADEQGRFVVVLPYPPLSHGFGGSPGNLGHRPLFEQSWLLRLAVFYEPAAQMPLAGADVPHYLGVLRQSPAEIYHMRPESGGAPWPDISLELGYDRHPTIRTEGLSQLLVAPGAASP